VFAWERRICLSLSISAPQSMCVSYISIAIFASVSHSLCFCPMFLSLSLSLSLLPSLTSSSSRRLSRLSPSEEVDIFDHQTQHPNEDGRVVNELLRRFGLST
jgi:hypothetical protein